MPKQTANESGDFPGRFIFPRAGKFGASAAGNELIRHEETRYDLTKGYSLSLSLVGSFAYYTGDK